MSKDTIMNQANTLSDVLAAVAPNDKTRRIPPLDKWQPTQVSPIDIEIRDNGEWWHEGGRITRQPLVDLFASVLWCEQTADGQVLHYLKTPYDKYQIRVADAPLFISAVDRVTGSDGVVWVMMTTTNGDVMRLDEAHLPYFGQYHHEGQNEERLYVDVRFNLKARFLNNAFFHLVNMGELSVNNDNKTVLNISSGGKIHCMTSYL